MLLLQNLYLDTNSLKNQLPDLFEYYEITTIQGGLIFLHFALASFHVRLAKFLPIEHVFLFNYSKNSSFTDNQEALGQVPGFTNSLTNRLLCIISYVQTKFSVINKFNKMN